MRNILIRCVDFYYGPLLHAGKIVVKGGNVLLSHFYWCETVCMKRLQYKLLPWFQRTSVWNQRRLQKGFRCFKVALWLTRGSFCLSCHTRDLFIYFFFDYVSGLQIVFTYLCLAFLNKKIILHVSRPAPLFFSLGSFQPQSSKSVISFCIFQTRTYVFSSSLNTSELCVCPLTFFRLRCQAYSRPGGNLALPLQWDLWSSSSNWK